MSVDPLGLAYLVLAMATESAAQLLLKVGSGGGSAVLAGAARRVLGASRVLAGPAPWIAGGVLAYVAEVALYTLALGRLRVGIAFPLGSLCFVGVAVLSRVFLGEAVGPRRISGIALILAGVALLTT
jgi:multidrug transporter EmrE-like cation transporter